jgi:SAM-dependent methyltransferase
MHFPSRWGRVTGILAQVVGVASDRKSVQEWCDMPQDIANAEQANAWNGHEGEYWATHQDRYDAAIRGHNARLLDAAQISTDAHVLDIGCGCGESTRGAARTASSGGALGVDLSSPMLARARERARAEGMGNVTFERADAQVHPFEAGAFDVAISRFGAMFFSDAVAAFTSVGRALRPGGRLALVSWQPLERNEWLLALRASLAMGRTLPVPPVGVPGPFGLADPDGVRRILYDAGYVDVDLAEIREPFRFGSDAEDAFGFVRGIGVVQGLIEDLDEATTAQALERLRMTLASHETNDGVQFDSCAWLTTARRP